MYYISKSIEVKGFYWDVELFPEKIYHILAYQVILLFIVSFQEELTCRAYLIKNLAYKKPIVPIVISSTIFMFLHTQNISPNSLVTKIGLINIFIIGLIYGYYYYYTNDLWFIIGTHFSWNFVMGSFFSLPISNDKSVGILDVDIIGKDFIIGGEFGPEGGLVVSLFLIIMFITIHIYVKKYCIKTQY